MLRPSSLFKTSIYLAALGGCWAYLPQTAFSQTTSTEQESPVPEIEQTAPNETAVADSNEPKVDDDQAELDSLLLGPWVLLPTADGKLPNENTIKTAISRCLLTQNIKKLNIEPGAARKLPESKDLNGDIVYYRTKKGLQRFDFGAGQLALLTEHKKVESDGSPTIWAVRGKSLGFALRFANTKKRGGIAQFMMENKNLYLRCRLDKNILAPKE